MRASARNLRAAAVQSRRRRRPFASVVWCAASAHSVWPASGLHFQVGLERYRLSVDVINWSGSGFWQADDDDFSC